MPGSDGDRWFRDRELFRESRLDSLGVPHGVTLRSLGNMKDSARRGAACRAAGLEAPALVPVQRHGTEVLEASAERPAGDVLPEGDGWVTASRGLSVGVFVADCLPIFLWDKALEAVGVFHAGWRGLSAGMARMAVRAFRRFGMDARRLSAAVGPHVCACCYRVGRELQGRFRSESFQEDSEGLRLDLGFEAREQLIEAGLQPEEISVSSACTACNPRDFFSYRREKLDQRMLALIALPTR